MYYIKINTLQICISWNYICFYNRNAIVIKRQSKKNTIRNPCNPKRQTILKLKEQQLKYNFRLIYELDDIPVIEDIPEYNIARKEYNYKEVQDSFWKILNLVDEMTVTCHFMKQYFQNKD